MDIRDWLRREHPELECVEHGDPYLTRIVRFDEHIGEYGPVNRDWHAVTDLEADMIVEAAEHAARVRVGAARALVAARQSAGALTGTVRLESRDPSLLLKSRSRL